MPKVGSLGLDMMTRTCTVQVNLDFGSEADMVKKFRVSLALQPIATALFADSPFTEGKPNGYLSYRSHIWTDTDPDRTGMLDFVFEDGFGFERYVDYLLDVPMYFVYRDGEYIDASGQSFRDFLRRQAAGVTRAQRPTLRDWADHMHHRVPGSAAEEVPGDARRRLAARGTASARCRRSGSACSTTMPRSTRRGTWSRTSPCEERHALRDGVPRHALKLPFRGGTVLDLARRGAGDLRARPAPARAPQPQRRRRVDLPGADDGVRRSRHHPGRAQARAVPWPVGAATSTGCSASSRTDRPRLRLREASRCLCTSVDRQRLAMPASIAGSMRMRARVECRAGVADRRVRAGRARTRWSAARWSTARCASRSTTA